MSSSAAASSGIALTALLMPLTLGAVIVPAAARSAPAAVAMAMAVLCALLTLQLSAGPALALIGLAGGLAGMAWERVS